MKKYDFSLITNPLIDIKKKGKRIDFAFSLLCQHPDWAPTLKIRI